MKMPTKAELQRLQKIYRTDKKIGEALGGIPEYLVAYWRRKKGISKPSFAKYSEQQIRELWERYGDDFHCGRELGISKAAFYSWRRRYNIKEKPQALKLEQLEFRFGSETKMGRNGVFVEYYQTAFQKILAASAERENVQPGELVRLTPDLLLLPIERAVEMDDHDYSKRCYFVAPLQVSSAPVKIETSHLVNGCFDLYQRGLIRPNMLLVSTFPQLHAMGAFSAAVVMIDDKYSEAALAKAVDYQVPEMVRVNIPSKLPRGLSVVDLMGFFVEQLKIESLKGKLVEFSGSGIEKFSAEDKMSLCLFTKILGAESAFCLFDELTRKTLARRTKVNYKMLFSDKSAHYESDFLLNTVGLESYIFKSTADLRPERISESSKIKPDLVFLGGACGGSFGLLKAAADAVRGQKCLKGIRCFVSPMTQDDLTEAIRKKVANTLVEFGCELLPVGLTLNGFLEMFKPTGTLLTVPDFHDTADHEIEIIFSSAESALRLASGKKSG